MAWEAEAAGLQVCRRGPRAGTMSAWQEGSNKKQIYVAGLPKDITEKELIEKFGQVGPKH